jgi:ribosomal protein L21E
VDEFTGFMILVPVVTQSAAEVVSKLVERVVGTFGAPGAFLSDNGSAFTADLAKHVFEAMGTQHTLTFSHWARGNAQNERSHQSIMSAIRITCEAWKGDWLRVLPYVALSYNTSAKEGTSLTPYDLVFGRSPRPLQSAILPPRRPDLVGRSAEEIGLDIKEVTRSLRDAWRALRRDNFKRKEAERLPAAATFAPGDQVLIVYERGAERTSKHFYRAHGPGTVLRRDKDDYIVKINSTGTERKVPWIVLHRYYARTAKSGAPGEVGTSVQHLQSNAAAAIAAAATAEQDRGGSISSSSSSSSSSDRHETQQRQRQEQQLRDGPRSSSSNSSSSDDRHVTQQLGRQPERRTQDAGRGTLTRSARRDKTPPKAKMRSPAARPFAADSEDDSAGSENEHLGPRTWRALVQPTRNVPPATSPTRGAGPAKPLDRLSVQPDDFVLVDGVGGGCSLAKVMKVEEDSDQVLVRWYGPERARASIPELARWLPMWATGSGSSVATAHPKRGYQPDEHDVDRQRISFVFTDLDDDQTLPQPVLQFLQHDGAKQS